MRKLKPSTTFENPSYSEVQSLIRLKKSSSLPCGSLRPLVSPPADERREARGKWRRRLRLRAVAICPGRQVPEEGSTERLLPDWGHVQRHSQPGERGQRRITSLCQQESEEKKKKQWREEEKKTKCFAQNLFFYAACVQILTWFKEERCISIELRKEKESMSVTLPSDFRMPILVLMFSLFWCTICISLHWSCW